MLVGDGVAERLRADFEARDIEGVHCTGYVPHDQMVHVYQLAEFFVLVTLYESFAIPLVEAMASGCPAIAPSTGACPEVAGGAARLVDPRDEDDIAAALAELEGSDIERAGLRSRGLSRAADFSWQRSAAGTLEIFDRIAPRRQEAQEESEARSG